MKIYVASSWRNTDQPEVVRRLREAGHEAYDFRHPPGGDHLGFSWADVDPDWESWTPAQYLSALNHPIAQAGFKSDFAAMRWADACVLVLPCGRSAHLEAGWFAGEKKPLIVLLDDREFYSEGGHSVIELMYKMATAVETHILDVLKDLAGLSVTTLQGTDPPVSEEGRRLLARAHEAWVHHLATPPSDVHWSIRKIEREVDETFDLRWDADMRAIKRWQDAHPGNDLVWPDHADMVVWLLEQLDEMKGYCMGCSRAVNVSSDAGHEDGCAAVSIIVQRRGVPGG